MMELVPWMVPLTDSVVVCKDSALLACFEVSPVDADAAGEGQVAQLAHAADRFVHAFRDLPVTLWWTVRRERTRDYPGEPMPDPVSQLLDDEHRAEFERHASFRNRHFVSVLWMPPEGTSNLIGRIGALVAEGVSPVRAIVMTLRSLTGGRDTFAWRGAELDVALNEFDAKLFQASSILTDMRPRRLEGTELMGFLWAQANPGLQMAPKAWNGHSFLDSIAAERPVTVFRESLRFGDGADATWASVISLKDVPAAIEFDVFSNLLALPHELVITHVFRVMGSQQAHKHIENARRVLDLTKYRLKSWLYGAAFRQGEMNEDKADPAKAEMSEALREATGAVTSGRVMLGWHHFNLVLLADDETRLEEATRATLRLFHGSPWVGALRESLHALSAWSASMPGQWRECRRWLVLSSVNANNMAPYLGVEMGQRENPHLTQQLGRRCQALTVLRTEYLTPYYFNFHVGALGHSFVVGPSRSGKSAGMNFLISQFRKYGDSARVLIFDKDYSCRNATLLQGGQHIDLRGGGEVKLNPVALVRDQRHWPFLARWLESLIGSRGYHVTSTDERAIHEAIQGVAALRQADLHTLSSINEHLPQHLQREMESWLGDRQYGSYFDNVEDSFSLGTFTCIEMNEVMRDRRIARLFLDYAFYRISEMLAASMESRARATMIYVEECWFLLEDEQFSARLVDWLKTFAKLNAFVVLCTQSIEDLMNAPTTVFAAIRDNIPTRIFLPNPNALAEDLHDLYKRQFQLRDDQVERIATAIPRLEYYIVRPDVARKVQLPLTRKQLAVVRSDMAAQRLFVRHYEARHTNPNWIMDYIEEVQKL